MPGASGIMDLAGQARAQLSEAMQEAELDEVENTSKYTKALVEKLATIDVHLQQINVAAERIVRQKARADAA